MMYHMTDELPPSLIERRRAERSALEQRARNGDREAGVELVERCRRGAAPTGWDHGTITDEAIAGVLARRAGRKPPYLS